LIKPFALITWVVCVFVLATSARAADFAAVTVESIVGQPVSGYVELPDLAQDDLTSLQVQLASPSTYADNDVAYYSVHENLRFYATFAANGRVRLELSSIGALREPQLNVLVRLTWRDRLALKVLTLSVPFSQRTLSGPRSVLTKSSDNLWQLAKRSRDGDQVSIAQQMLAIQRLNPDAFSKGNINGLKRGFLLRIPEFMDAVTVNKASARSAVQGQNSAWRDGSQDSSTAQRKVLPTPSSESVTPEDFELGADLPPLQSRGEVRIFEPERSADSGVDLGAENRPDQNALRANREATVRGGSASMPPLGTNVREVTVEQFNDDNGKPVNIDQSVNDQIDLMLEQENQGSYSAQLVWLIAGGILAILVVVMLLRRQMAARKKNLEDAWVGEISEQEKEFENEDENLDLDFEQEYSDGEDEGDDEDFDSALHLEPEPEPEQASHSDVERDLDQNFEQELQEGKLSLPDGSEPQSQDTVTAQETLAEVSSHTQKRSDSEDKPLVPTLTDKRNPQEPIVSQPEEANAPQPPVNTEVAPGAIAGPIEEQEEESSTFINMLNPLEQPLEETSNTEVYTTRLKLAEAYLEMGDEQGARDMLEEVAAEGEEAQRALAKSIIQRIDDGLDDDEKT
jgi:FimV-like protein